MGRVVRVKLHRIGKDGTREGARLQVRCQHCGRIFPTSVRYGLRTPTVYCTFCHQAHRLLLVWDPPSGPAGSGPTG